MTSEIEENWKKVCKPKRRNYHRMSKIATGVTMTVRNGCNMTVENMYSLQNLICSEAATISANS